LRLGRNLSESVENCVGSGTLDQPAKLSREVGALSIEPSEWRGEPSHQGIPLSP
jgi:hypothetical protein